MLLKNEDQVLNQDFRQSAIEEFESDANIQRKKDSKYRYEIYEDDIKQKVIDDFKKEMPRGVNECVINRISDVNICKKIIKKKAIIYKNKSIKETDEAHQEDLINLFDETDFDSLCKKINKYVELDNTVEVGFLPYMDEDTNLVYLKASILKGFQYDPIFDSQDNEKVRAIVISYFSESKAFYAQEGAAAIHGETKVKETNIETEKKNYIWWTAHYHFTTDNKGNVIQGEGFGDGLNPIGILPFVTYKKTDGDSYWSTFGRDIINGTIRINKLLTDLYYITKFQGMGLLYVTGRKIPDLIDVGPSTAITVKVEEGDPTPQIGFATSNPPVADHLSMIQQSLNLILTTNGLEPASISLTDAKSAESGIQEIIKRADNLSDIEDEIEMYKDNNPKLIRIMLEWFNLFRGRNLLGKQYDYIKTIPSDIVVTEKFPAPAVITTEKEKIEIIQLRRDAGLDTLRDSIKRDNPDMTDEDVEEKLAELIEQDEKKKADAIGEKPGIEDEEDLDSEDSSSSLNPNQNQIEPQKEK